MAPKSNVPIRIGGSKTRTGCTTCKRRHVKCDGLRPVCSKCQSAGRQCSYSLTQSREPEHPFDPVSQAGFVRPYSRYPELPSLDDRISSYGPRDLAEVSAVKNFAGNLGQELAGCFSDDAWSNAFPRIAQHEPSVWHAMVAISLLHTNIRLGYNRHDVNLDVTTAIRQYSKAIQELNRRLESVESASSRDVVLICCIFFAVFECLQCHFHSAMQHICSGTKLLREWRSEAISDNHHTDGYLDHKIIQPIFLSLDSQAIQMGLADYSYDLSKAVVNDWVQISPTFPTIEEAHTSLNAIFNHMSHWSQLLGYNTGKSHELKDYWVTDQGQRLRAQLGQWDFAFGSLLELLNPEPATFLLLTQRKVIEIYFNKEMDGSKEIQWDKYLSLFQEAIEYAEAYLTSAGENRGSFTTDAESSSSGFNKRRPMFIVAMDIVLSLFLIGAKCRNREIRRRAYRMLEDCDRREGIWDSYLCAKVVEKIITLEESGALEDGCIPDSARIYGIDVRLGVGAGEKEADEEEDADEIGRRLLLDEDEFQHFDKLEEQ